MRPRSTQEAWYTEGLRFTCTSCGRCCQGPPPGDVFVDRPDIERLVGHLETTLEAFGRRYMRRVRGNRLSLTEKQNQDCIFWSDEEGCVVYRARPKQCRQFPFWPENLVDADAWREAAASCPGMNRGRLYSAELIERMLKGRRGTRAGRRPQPVSE